MNIKKTFLVLSLGLVFLLASLATNLFNSATNQSAATTWDVINQEQLLNEVEQDDVIIVDLREPELYTESHIAGAINIPYAEFKSRYQELDKDQLIIFVCHGGPMGDSTSRFLVKKGYANVANLEGGMAYWNGPVVN